MAKASKPKSSARRLAAAKQEILRRAHTTVSAAKPKVIASRLLGIVKEFQSTVGLKQSGKLDDETVSLLNRPRCGTTTRTLAAPVRGMVALSSTGQIGVPWGTRSLDFALIRTPTGVSRSATLNVINQALALWANAGNLTLGIVSAVQDANLVLSWERRFHPRPDDDCRPFVMVPGVEIGHAFGPANSSPAEPYFACAHFNNEIPWSTTGSGVTHRLVSAILHEVGHLLGLVHSSRTTSIMHEFYDPSRNGPDPQDDQTLFNLYSNIP